MLVCKATMSYRKEDEEVMVDTSSKEISFPLKLQGERLQKESEICPNECHDGVGLCEGQPSGDVSLCQMQSISDHQEMYHGYIVSEDKILYTD